MTECHRDLRLLELNCRETVESVIARHNWTLVDATELTRRVVAYVCSGETSDPRRAAIYAYSLALYQACSGAEGEDRQNRGYTELSDYLHAVALRRYPAGCEDAVQQALETIFTSFDRCRKPGAFLAFALQHVLDATRALQRQDRRHSNWRLHPPGPCDAPSDEALADPECEDPCARALELEQRKRIHQRAAEFIREHPRASYQFRALWLKYINGLDDVTISQRLGKPLANVYVLRCRVIKRLRSHPQWQALMNE